MSEWLDVTLADISDQRKGINYKSEYYCDEDSGHPFITIKCFVKGGGYQPRGIKYFDGPSTPQDKLKTGDVLISVTDLTRAGDIVGSPLQVPDFGSERSAIASMDCMKIAPKDGKCDSEFLYFRMMLPDIRRQMVAYSAGSTVLHLDTKKVPSMKIRIPQDIDHQKKLAGVLKLLTESIEQTEALIEKYSLIKAGMMHDLFTRGLTPDGKLRPPREEAPGLYKETPIGWIPNEWETSSLEEIADVVDPNPSHRNPIYHPEGFAFISTVEFGDYDTVETNTPRKVIEEIVLEQERRCKFSENSIAFSRKGTIGETRFLPTHLRFALLDSLCVVNPKSVDSFYLFWALRCPSVRKSIKVQTVGQALPQMSIGRVRELEVPYPKDPNEQEAIGQIMRTADLRQSSEGGKLEKLKKQKAGLMHDLLSGEVPVNVDEPEAANV